ncbi:bifunctional DNA primase/polymerase, partial [Streptococcus suis]
KGLLVIDVDARNNGVQAFERLCADTGLDLLGLSGLAVATGSGGGSMHLYFHAPPEMALVQHHNDYPGIDFKSSGFVVG